MTTDAAPGSVSLGMIEEATKNLNDKVFDLETAISNLLYYPSSVSPPSDIVRGVDRFNSILDTLQEVTRRIMYTTEHINSRGETSMVQDNGRTPDLPR